jgi:hypothetical protein
LSTSGVWPSGPAVFGTRVQGFPSIQDLLDKHREQAAVPRVAIATAYWDATIIRRAAELADGSDQSVRLLLWLDGGSRSALTGLRADAERGEVEVKFVGSPDSAGIFHIKLYGLLDGDGPWKHALVGSPNFTDAAMRSNLELAVLLDDTEQVAKLQTWFDQQFHAAIPASKLDWTAALERLPENDPGERRRNSTSAKQVAPDALADAPRPRRNSGKPQPELDLVDLFEAASGLMVEADQGGAVLELDSQIGAESLKRTRLERDGTTLYLKFWPAELQDQATAFYTSERAERVLEANTREEWDCSPLPNLAYWNAPWQNREYFGFAGTLKQYIQIWRDNPKATTGAKSPKFENERWPTLLEIGAFPDTEAAHEQLQRIVNHSNRADRPLQVRPTVEMVRRIEVDGTNPVLAVRGALREALEILQEPSLPPHPIDSGNGAATDGWVTVVAAEDAYPVYKQAGVYWCQDDRTFSTPVSRIGFYHDKAIEPELPLALERITGTTIAELEQSPDSGHQSLAARISGAIAAGLPGPKEPFDIYDLTTAGDERTIKLAQRVPHQRPGRGKGFTQKHRFVKLDALLANPASTDELA